MTEHEPDPSFYAGIIPLISTRKEPLGIALPTNTYVRFYRSLIANDGVNLVWHSQILCQSVLCLETMSTHLSLIGQQDLATSDQIHHNDYCQSKIRIKLYRMVRQFLGAFSMWALMYMLKQ